MIQSCMIVKDYALISRQLYVLRLCGFSTPLSSKEAVCDIVVGVDPGKNLSVAFSMGGHWKNILSVVITFL